MSMFCYQCEQVAHGSGCTVSGVCGKQPDTAGLQDVLIYQLQGISFYAHHARKLGVSNESVDHFTIQALFSTVTNVNFDNQRLESLIYKASEIRDTIKSHYEKAAKAPNAAVVSAPQSASFIPSKDKTELAAQSQHYAPHSEKIDPDLKSLKHTLLYGLKGMAAYADHAYVLGKKDETIFAFIHEALNALNKSDIDMNELVNLALTCGKVNIRTMELLNEAHIQRFGKPTPVQVSTSILAGPAIIVSGHDLLDLEELLKQTAGKGINIYTHGEMLPAHGYPGLKKYPHLAGHFGTAWQNQQKEFDSINAAILFTTNCIQKPKPSYFDRVFTTGLVAWPQVTHVPNNNFSKVIEKAKALGGLKPSTGSNLMTGFGHDAVLAVAGTVIEAVKNGAIKHFFLVGGCDGAKPGRNYFTDFVEKTPKDTVVLTLACGKFRFNHLELGSIGGIPRLLDIGQCNDAYSAVRIALALADAFKCTVNDLPLSLVLSWYEQKAVVILLSLLHLGIKNIRLGPSLPAFITPNVLNFLVENFNIKPITTAEKDLADILHK